MPEISNATKEPGTTSSANPENQKLGPVQKLEHYRKVWEKYEDVAMHFNGLIMSFRLKALGGIGLAVSIASGFGVGKSGIVQTDMLLTAGAGFFLFLASVWVAIFILDKFYYEDLLLGSVRALVQFERSPGLHVELSSCIEDWHQCRANVCKNIHCSRPSSKTWFYGIPLVFLVGASIYCFLEIKSWPENSMCRFVVAAMGALIFVMFVLLVLQTNLWAVGGIGSFPIV